MKLGLYFKLAWRNLKANKQLQVPFVLATSLMFGMLYIIGSLTKNQFVLERHQDLSTIMGMGVFIILVLCMIFMIYGQNFIGRRRSKEFSLYSILGFEKFHISMVIFIEQVINFVVISFLSISIGQLFGTLMFKFLNNLLKDSTATIGDYPLSMQGIVIVVVAIAATLFLLYLWQTLRISLLNPIELLSQDKSGEKPSKFQLLWLILGLISVGTGYYIAWTTEGLLDAMMFFFVAVLLVMAGTYLLFMSLIAFYLRRLKRNKDYYYKPSHFLSISGMIYRIRSNAVSLASIAILSTGFMLAMGTTITIYRSIEETVDLSQKHDYQIMLNDSVYALTEPDSEILNKRKNVEAIAEALKDFPEVKKTQVSENIMVEAKLKPKDHELVPLEANERGFSEDNYLIIFLQTLEEYNQENGTNYSLENNQLLVNDLNGVIENLPAMMVNGSTYQVVKNQDIFYSNIAIDHGLLVTPDRETMMAIARHYRDKEQEFGQGNYLINLDVSQDSPELYDKIVAALTDTPARVDNRLKLRESTYQLNGGFLFLGVIIGMVLLIGTVLMIYYKQITEGYDDQANYKIMKQVGLPEDLIKTTIKQQTFWLFALPVIVAVIHGVAASKIVYRLLGLFGIFDWTKFAFPYLIVITVFVIIYYLIYQITSRVYYQIVNEKE